MNRRWRTLWAGWLLALAGTLALFNLRPGLDLAVTAAVHDAAAATPFPLGQLAPVQALYHAVPWAGRLGVLLALAAIGLLGTPARRRRWAHIGLAAGLVIGAGRVLQGGHFLSDILVAGLVMHGTGLAIRQFWAGRRLQRQEAARMKRTETAATVSSRPPLVHPDAAIGSRPGS